MGSMRTTVDCFLYDQEPDELTPFDANDDGTVLRIGTAYETRVNLYFMGSSPVDQICALRNLLSEQIDKMKVLALGQAEKSGSGQAVDAGPCTFKIGLTTCGYTREQHHKADGSPMNHEYQAEPPADVVAVPIPPVEIDDSTPF